MVTHTHIHTHTTTSITLAAHAHRGLITLVTTTAGLHPPTRLPFCAQCTCCSKLKLPTSSNCYTLDYLGLFMTFLFGTIYLVNINMRMPYACTMPLNLHVVARCYCGRDEGFCWSINKYGDSKINQYKKYWFTTTELPVFHCFLQG